MASPKPLKPPMAQNPESQSPETFLTQAMADLNPSNIGPSSLPPALAATAGKTTQEILADLNTSPLFMTDLEENNPGIDALQALAYEGTPLEIAQNFKERGNECFGEKKWVDAKEFYSKGVVVLRGEEKKRRDGGGEDHVLSTDDEEVQKELALLSTLLTNRAATHLSLKNYRSASIDSRDALTLSLKNLKAHYRLSLALYSLSHLSEASSICTAGLALSPTDPSLLALATKISTAEEEIARKKQREDKEKEREAKERDLLSKALQAREIWTRSTPEGKASSGGGIGNYKGGIEIGDARVRLLPDPLDPTSHLVFPTMFLYPLILQSDFIPQFAETDTLKERLEEALADEWPEWDPTREYTLSNVDCYMEKRGGGLVRLGKGVTLLAALSGGKTEVVDGVVKIFVVPKTKAEEWIKKFKERQGKGRS